VSAVLPRSGPRWSRRKQARPGELIAAALDVFVERGFAAARLEDVAARAGVTKGTLYLYFESKEELFKAVVRSALVPILRQAGDFMGTFDGSTPELLRNMIKGWWKSVRGTAVEGLPKLVIAESGNFPEIARFYYDEVIRPARDVFGRVLARGMDRGEFRRFDVDYLERVAVAPLVMLTVWLHTFARYEGPGFDPARYLDTYLDVLIAALHPANGPGEVAREPDREA